MVISDFKLFQEFEKSCGNKYLAVKFIASAARKLGKEKSKYHITESKLIQWVLTGECPYTRAQMEAMYRDPSEDKIDEVLCWISDDAVSNRVRKLYKESIRNRHLIMCEDTNISKSRVDRINILLRMIWFSTGDLEEDN